MKIKCTTIFGCIFLLQFFLIYDSNAQKITKGATGQIDLVFSLTINGKTYHPDSLYFLNGIPISLTQVQFFVSHVALASAGGNEIRPSTLKEATVYLIDFRKNSKISFPIKSGSYSEIRFDIGLPREINHNDPLQQVYPLRVTDSDMFWEWSAGYVFFKAEGLSNLLPGGRFHFAIGEDTRIMPFSFGNLFDVKPKIEVSSAKSIRVYFELDFAKLLNDNEGVIYPIQDKGAYIVHGGKYADILRANILKSLKLISIE